MFSLKCTFSLNFRRFFIKASPVKDYFHLFDENKTFSVQQFGVWLDERSQGAQETALRGRVCQMIPPMNLKNSKLFFSYLEGEDSDDEGRETDQRVQAGMCCV